jgi:GH15 family glucan-1,4-alpha-glucosidase
MLNETSPAFEGGQPTYPAISDYGAIGDCRSAALISRDGSIDWLCWPRFDSPSIFAAILDPERGGRWSISPSSPYKAERRYLHESNVLETTFRTDTGTVALTDLMPVLDASISGVMVPDHEIIRRLTCISGEVEVEAKLAPRTNYGEELPPIRDVGKLGIRIQSGAGVYWLRSNIATQIGHSSKSVFARSRLRAGDTLLFSFSYSAHAPAVLPSLEQIPHRIDACVKWWQDWAAQAQYDGDFRDEIVRSALALKLMTFTPSGAIIAAPTTSLPESMGGNLNWDYRYCWLRDASLTVRALTELGYWDEATAFLDWMLHATWLTQPELRILYSVFGNTPPPERLSSTLRGYRNSAPVRIGNAARDQLQLDVYGEVIDSAAQYAFRGGELDRSTRNVLVGLGNYVVKHWNLPDEGIWEPRSGRRHHTHSRLLCWAALDRLVSLYEQGKLKGADVDAEEYRKQRDHIHLQIEQRGWSEQEQSYVSELDGDQLDSSLLLISWYGFEKADSFRMRATHRALRKRLGTPEGLLYRSESLPPEGTFAICSFWEAEYLALGGGSVEQTRELIKTLLGFRNDLGLYAEEIEPGTGQALGNFPQAYTHVGLINAALSLQQREQGEAQLAHRPEHAVAQPGRAAAL